jgi:N-acetylneuraminic acid mutarotase
MYSPPKTSHFLAIAAISFLSIAGCGGGGYGGGAGGGGSPATYTVGGTVSGLTASGLVLTNGSETVSPASGSTSYAFPTALPTGSTYAVAVQTQPSSELCQVVFGVGKIANAAVTNVAVRCTRPWTWVAGAKTVGAKGVYGTQGKPAAGNVPGARSGSVSWIDSVGDLWLFGGNGIDSAGTSGDLNDLWRYSPASAQWTWIGGSNKANATGVYGTQGSEAASNVPGARRLAVSWVDSAGDVWLFGGFGFDSAGTIDGLNDLWRYSPASGQWTWVGGSNKVDAPGVYGTEGTAAAGNVPGARLRSVAWIDSAGNLWLFGGGGNDSTPTVGRLNDLWRYSPTSGQWTWVSGSSTVDAQGVYGTQGTATAANVPGSRTSPVSWIDSAGDLWLFGGDGLDTNGNRANLNDLWRYSPATGQWTWLSGSDTGDADGVYGTQGTAAPANVPGGRAGSVGWLDSSGNLWLFGGYGHDSAGVGDELNDLWRFSPASGQWTWVGGMDTAADVGFYGTPGSPGVPGARENPASWIDSQGHLWLFGGAAYDSVAATGVINDMWTF